MRSCGQDEMNMSPRLRYLVRLTNNRPYSKMSEPLVPLPDVEKLSERVIRVLGGNPSKVSSVLEVVGRSSDKLPVHSTRHKHIHRWHRRKAITDRHRRRQGSMDTILKIHAVKAQYHNRQGAYITLASRSCPGRTRPTLSLARHTNPQKSLTWHR